MSIKFIPEHLRAKLLIYLSEIGILPIIVTGSMNKIDLDIKRNLPILPNNF